MELLTAYREIRRMSFTCRFMDDPREEDRFELEQDARIERRSRALLIILEWAKTNGHDYVAEWATEGLK